IGEGHPGYAEGGGAGAFEGKTDLLAELGG
ncbi:hypothetical protein V491_02793, partial [Pseudogymnoascus sp. VKM F-3775]